MNSNRLLAIVASGVLLLGLACSCWATQQSVKIALIYPDTGPFYKEGKDLWRAAHLAKLQINRQGGILDQVLDLVTYDCASSVSLATQKALHAIDTIGVKMVFGAVSSDVAIALSRVCQEKRVPFFASAAYSAALTTTQARYYAFRECSDSWMTANALSVYLNTHFSGKKCFYITSDNTWGWTTEATLRKASHTDNRAIHPGVMVPIGMHSYKDVLLKAARQKPDVLILTLFGKDMATTVRTAWEMKLKDRMQIIVPNLSLGMAEMGSPAAMEGIVGTVPWCWVVPYVYDYQQGIQFVEDFAKKFQRYPSSAAASAYTIVNEYKAAVERASAFEPAAVVAALEGHTYQLLKDQQTWREFDHQCVQTIYLVRCRPRQEVAKHRNLDYFEVVESFSGNAILHSRSQWNQVRNMAGESLQLERIR